MSRSRKGSEGFTLIELLIVVAVIGVLAAIAFPIFGEYRVRSYNTLAVTDLKNLRSALEGFWTDNNRYP